MIDDVVTLSAVRVAISFVVEALEESAVPVVLSAVLKMMVAIQFCEGYGDEPSVACAKYWTLNVVVVFCDPFEQVLDAVNAVAA